MMSRRALADAIDALDEQITELQREKAETYAAYRAQVEGTGVHKGQVKLELAAAKVAIRHRQQLAKDRETVVERGELVDEIVVEICSGTGNAIIETARASRASGLAAVR